MATPFTAPPTRFNEPITPHRRIALTAVPLATVKKVKAVFGVTVNDVVLALCGGALRRYLVSHGELPERPLVGAVPVSVRGGDAPGDTEAASANQISGMTVSLATDVADPVERLQRVSEAARGAKDEHETLGRDLVPELGEFAASQLFGRGARFYSRSGLAGLHPPAVNLVVSNVPGPDFPLYFAGARLLALYPLGPIYDGVGLNLTVFSYLDRVGFGFVGGAELAPDLSDLADAVDESLNELEKEADATARV
jgi:diacylglycerol O-acyltransferase / wax synthase